MKVLVPIDGSDCSLVTLRWAALTLNKESTQYYLLSVVSDMMRAEFEIPYFTELLDKAHNELTQSGCNVIKAEFVMGDPVTEVCKYADTMDVDQVLVGSHGRTGMAKAFLGSVSTGIMEHCHKPVLLFRNVERPVEDKSERPDPKFSLYSQLIR